MLPVYFALIIAGLFTVAGFLLWLVLYVLKIRGKAWKIFKTTALSLLFFLPCCIFLLAPLVISYLVANASTRRGDQALTHTPATFGRPFLDVEFCSRDGLTLSGWFMEGEKGKPTFILCHGLFRNRQELLERACLLHQAGYSILLFDFRNHGKSPHRFVSLGFQERLDVLGAYDLIRERQPEPQIVLFGVSMGAVAAIHAAAPMQEDLRAIIADSPFQSLKETVSQHTNLFLNLPAFPFAGIFIWNLTRINEYDKEQLDTIQALQRIGETSVLLIYGKDDPRLPESTARAVFDGIPSVNKRILFFDGAGHAAAYRVDPSLYLKTIVEFAEKSSGRQRPEP